MHAYTCTHTSCIHTYTYTYAFTLMRIYTHTCIQTQKQTLTHTHTHTHTGFAASVQTIEGPGRQILYAQAQGHSQPPHCHP